jgi:ankyrin repeat protein
MVILNSAATHNNIKAIEYLVNAGAQINSKNSKSLTPLMTTIQNGANSQTIVTLLKLGADVNIQDKRGFTALMHAINYNCSGLAEILIAHGAKLHLRTNEDTYYRTAYEMASPRDHTEIKRLIENEMIRKIEETHEMVTKIYQFLNNPAVAETKPVDQNVTESPTPPVEQPETTA